MSVKRKTRARKEPAAIAAASPLLGAAQAQPQWLLAMREHFQRTGYYRAEDLLRVMGDPTETVEIASCSDIHVACRAQK